MEELIIDSLQKEEKASFARRLNNCVGQSELILRALNRRPHRGNGTILAYFRTIRLACDSLRMLCSGFRNRGGRKRLRLLHVVKSFKSIILKDMDR